MGLSYNPKPDFIERIIEDAAFRFFEAFACFTKAGAATEVGEKAGFPARIDHLLEDAQISLNRVAELYDSLFQSIENIPIEPAARHGLRNFDFQAMLRLMSTQGSVAISDKVFEEFSAAVQAGNPVNVLRAYARRVEKTGASLTEFRKNIASGKLDPIVGHVCLTNFIETTLYGQYVATLNRMSREGTQGRSPEIPDTITEKEAAALKEAFKDFDVKAKPDSQAAAAASGKVIFCTNWPKAKSVLEFLLQVPEVPSPVKSAIWLAIRAGDLVSRTIC